jgi:hypothetical protein
MLGTVSRQYPAATSPAVAGGKTFAGLHLDLRSFRKKPA